MNEPEVRHDQFGTPRRGRKLFIFASLFLMCAGLAVALYFYEEHMAQKRLDAAIAEAERQDPYWRLDDMEANREVIPDDKNAALVVTNVAQYLPSGGWTFQNTEPHSARQLSAEQIHLLRDQLKAVGPALNMARKLKDMPKGRYPVQWSEDAVSTLLPHIQKARELANLLSADATLRAHDNDVDGAMDSCQAMLNAGRSLGDEPTYISMLVRIAIRIVALGRLEATLAQGQPSEAALRASQQAWEDEGKTPLMFVAARGERAFGDRTITAIQNGKTSSSAVVSMGAGKGGPSGVAGLDKIIVSFQVGSLVTNRAALLELQNEMIEISRLPESERQARLDQIRDRAARLPFLARELIPAAHKVAQAIARSDGLMRPTVAALAAERYRIAHGRWPDSLAALVPQYLPAVPTDPYDGAPLRYRRLSDGVVIYSIGMDLQDNGGTLGNGVAPGTDVGIRLWDVDKRRQPPLPPISEDSAGKN